MEIKILQKHLKDLAENKTIWEEENLEIRKNESSSSSISPPPPIIRRHLSPPPPPPPYPKPRSSLPSSDTEDDHDLLEEWRTPKV
jgi:hypothetical protein